ncbi:phosphoribosylpyrophosphate synthetase [Bernardetia sp.]|uniref:phosphoribosylpyrophosphate synthetase n=1 Tax=Bernardetia sp. TaxID=1937974 RepID=UPI0025C451FF|nr:phosphoribosylpyrophosphate synthetase [Bernardetia sp.]
MDTKKQDRIILEELQNTNTNPDPNSPLHTLDTLSETMNALKNKGYTTDFNLDKDCLVCTHEGKEIHVYPQEFEIDDTFRFEGETNPADESVLYAISSEKHNLKGVLVNAYGVYANDTVGEMAKKFK